MGTTKQTSPVTTDLLEPRAGSGVDGNMYAGTRRGVPSRGRGSSDDEADAKPARRLTGSGSTRVDEELQRR